MLQRVARGSIAVAVAMTVLLAVSFTTHEAPVANAQDVLSSIQEGMREYKKGNWERAIEKFDEALAGLPSADDSARVAEARKIRDEIGAELAQDFINNNFREPGLKGRYARFGKWVVAGLKTSPYIGRVNNEAEIAEFVDAYMSDSDIARNLIRAASIRDKYGDFAVPYIQANYMHSENEDHRYRSRVLLKTLGAQAVNAIIQCFYSDEMYDRQVGALALGDIADPRALPILAKHFQDSNENAQVREACSMAIRWIRSENPEQDKKINEAKDLFYLQAEGYYRNNAAGRYYRNRLVGTTYQGHLPVVMYQMDRQYTVWKWIPDADGVSALKPREVPLWSYADILAEESAMQALELGISRAGGNANTNAFVRDTEALLAVIHFHMYTEGRSRYYNGSDGERQFITRLLGERGFVPQKHGWGLGALAGSPVLYTALERSLTDGYPAVSEAVCDAIAALGDTDVVGKKEGAAMIRALTDKDRMIRYAATRALIRLGAEKNFGNNEMVEQQATTALKESQARSVLVIVEDESLRNAYLRTLEGLQINATGARTLEEGADLATQGPPWDAIIIEGELAVAPVYVFEYPAMGGAADRDPKSEPIFHMLNADIRTAATPVLIASRESEIDRRKATLDSLNVPDQRFIRYSAEYTVDGETLKDTLDTIWMQNIEDAKSKSNQMVVALANAIGELNPKATKYSVDALLVALAGGLRREGRSSDAREAICKAIEKLASYSGSNVGAAWMRANIIPNLLDTIDAGPESLVDRPSVKAAAARALGAVYKNHRGAWDEDGFTSLRDMLRLDYDLDNIEGGEVFTREMQVESMKQEVMDARNAAGEALGKAPTTAAQRLEILRLQAVDPHRDLDR